MPTLCATTSFPVPTRNLPRYFTGYAPNPINMKPPQKTPTQLQNSALPTLPSHTLYIVLYIRNDPPQLNDFHWALYQHHNTTTGGMKYDVKNINNSWMTDHAWTGNIFKTNFLCVLIQIATLGDGDEEKEMSTLDLGIRSLDESVNEIPGVTCRVWLFVILERLAREGILRFGEGLENVGLLERECMDFGNAVMGDAAANVQPRPVVVSRFCR